MPGWYSGNEGWIGEPGFNSQCIAHNKTDDVSEWPAAGWVLPPHSLAADLYPDTKKVVLRWIAPEPLNVAVAAQFVGRNTNGSTTDVHVLKNGVSLFDATINGYLDSEQYSETMSVGIGDIIDFAVGDGGNGGCGDTTGIAASITPSPGVASGTVTSNGVGVGGATVQAVGTAFSTQAASNGSYSLSLAPGNYTLQASKVGYASDSADVTILGGETTTQNFDLKSGLVAGTVVANLAGDPPLRGAKVTADGAIQAVTGADGDYSLRLAPGAHTLVATCPGYESATDSVTVPDGGTATKNFSLNLINKTTWSAAGDFSWTSYPSDVWGYGYSTNINPGYLFLLYGGHIPTWYDPNLQGWTITEGSPNIITTSHIEGGI